MDVSEWYNGLTNSDTVRSAGSKIGVSHTTLSRQLRSGVLAAEVVIDLCRAYNRSPVTGLIETGYLQKWETEGVSIPYALEQATNEELLDEIMRRSDPQARYLFDGDEDTIGLSPNAMPLRAVADDSPEEWGTPDDFEP